MPVQVDVCSDLTDMVEVVDDFHKFLGPELKAVTGDTQVSAPHQRVAGAEFHRPARANIGLTCGMLWAAGGHAMPDAVLGCCRALMLSTAVSKP